MKPNWRRLIEWLVLAVVSITVLVVLLVQTPTTDVPDAQAILGADRFKPFLLEAESVQGIYRNHDIDSIVFTYQTRFDSAETFWSELNHRLESLQWRLIGSAASLRRYERIFNRGSKMFCSSEELRISLCRNKKVVVAWVQGDTLNDVKSFNETSESKFAERYVWPVFQKTIDQ